MNKTNRRLNIVLGGGGACASSLQVPFSLLSSRLSYSSFFLVEVVGMLKEVDCQHVFALYHIRHPPRQKFFDRLTMLGQLEKRDSFITRVRNAVRWININRRRELIYLSYNQKEHAEAVLQLDGSRTEW